MLRSQPNTVHDIISDESDAVLSSECNMLSSQPKITGCCNESSDSDSDDSESQSDEEVDFVQSPDEELDFGLLNSSGTKNMVMDSDSENGTDQSEVDDISDVLWVRARIPISKEPTNFNW